MRRTSSILAAVAVAGLALAPSLADARAGFGGSFGSRGGRTWSAPPTTGTAPYTAQPFQRSFTPNAPSAPSYGSPGFGGGFAGARSGAFTSGLLGGLIGAGIGGMLLGHGFFGGVSGGFGFLGFILQMLLLFFVVRWLVRMFRAPRPMMAGGGSGPSMFGLPRFGRPTPMRGGGGGAPQGRPVAITPADYGEFEGVLKAVQSAWTAQDMNALRQLASPEMVSFFGEQLAEQASRGVRNEVTDVRLIKGDLSEAWSEGSREYATVAMRFSMVDVTRDASGRIVDGSPQEHVTATEVWTFLRSPGGRWVLSAIQQAR